MSAIKKRLCEIVLGTTLVGTGMLGMLNIMSSEPLIMLSHPKQYIPNFTAQEYSRHYDTAVGKTFAYLVYPGAKLGRYIHNSRIDSS